MNLNNTIALNDKYYQNLYKSLIVFFVIVYGIVFYQLYEKSQLKLLEWTMSDWLVNYEDGGFKRRGLSGSLIFMIQDITRIPLSKIVLAIQVIFYSYILTIILKELIKKRIDFFFVSFLFSPFILMFPIVNIINSGRKEILLLALASYFAFGKSYRNNKNILILLFCFGIYLHELFYCFIPFFIWIDYAKTGKLDCTFSILLIAFSTISLVLIAFLGGDINQGQSLKILAERSTFIVKGGGIFGIGSIFYFNFFQDHILSFLLHFVEFVLSILTIGYYVFLFHKDKIRQFVIFNSIAILFVLPLFIGAIDWFRWIHIYTFLLFIVLFLFMDNNNDNKINFNSNKIKIWQTLISPFIFILFFVHVNNDRLLEIFINLLQ